MGDLLGFKGWMNVTAPFKWHEYEYEWKADRHYLDFEPSNEWNDSCVYPDMYGEDGWLLPQSILDKQDGCRAGEFDLVCSICESIVVVLYSDLLLVRFHQRCRRLPQLRIPTFKIRFRSRSSQGVAAGGPRKDQALFLLANSDARYRWLPYGQRSSDYR